MHNGWVYFKILCGIYGLSQSEIRANNFRKRRLVNHGYYQCATTLGLWRNKWHPILFDLIVDDFGLKCVGEQHAHHLCDILKEHYNITNNCKGDLYAGIKLAWYYEKRTCRLTIDNYIPNLLIKFIHPANQKHQHSPYKHTPIEYGAKMQYSK